MRAFTEAWIKSVKPQAKRIDYREPGRRGFFLRVEPTGSKSFAMRYGTNGKHVIVLGQWPSKTLAEAHKEHAHARELLARGIDPREDRARLQEVAELRKHESDTFGEMYDAWVKYEVRRERKRPEQVEQAFEKNVLNFVPKGSNLPPWRDRAGRSISKRDCVLLLNSIVDRGSPVMANRVYSMLKQMFLYCVGSDLLEHSPMLAVRKPGGEEKEKERHLSEAEIVALWPVLAGDYKKLHRSLRLALQLILVTAQRPGEVIGAPWTEIDFDAKLWTIGKERSKNARPHLVPLSDLALAILAELREMQAEHPRPYVVPSLHRKVKHEDPVSEKALARGLRNQWDKAGKLFDLEKFTPHDLRRTASTRMTSIGVSRFVVERILNHTAQDVTRIYDRHEYLAEKSEALQKWADKIKDLCQLAHTSQPKHKERLLVPSNPPSESTTSTAT